MKTRLLAYSLLVLSALLLCTGTVSAGLPEKLIIAHDANYPPFCSLDENGKPRGYLVDAWNAFARTNGVEVTFKLGTWKESLDYIRRGEADVHGGLFYSDNRDMFLDYGPTITDLSTHLYVRADATDKIIDQCAVGVVLDGYEEEFMRKERYRQVLIAFKDNKELLGAAARDEIKLFVADQPTAYYYMSLYQINDIFTEIEKLYTMPLRVAVGEGNQDLLDAIITGWERIDEQELKYIHKKWFLGETGTPQWYLTASILTGLVVVAAIIFRVISRRRHLPHN